MTQIQTMTNPELNRALAELMGNKIGRKVDYGFKPEYDRDVIALPNDRYKFIPDYCTDPAASLEVQAKALKECPAEYIHELGVVMWGRVYGDLPYYRIAEMLNATPRERAEAAYITLQGEMK